MITETKECTKCKAVKKLTEFYNNKGRSDGKHSQCIICHKSTQKPKTKEQANRDAKKYAEAHPELIKERWDTYYAANKIKLAKKRQISEQRPARKENVRQYNIKNRDRINENRRERRKNMPPKEKLEKSMRDRFQKVIIRMKSGKKYTSWRSLIGCSIEDLKKHIESQFIEGMEWSNHGNGTGKWNIDHIKPLVKFDLFQLSEQQIAFHYSNLRPLWFEDNMARNRKNWDESINALS